ncbi:Methionyl-tRNA formyltransferase [Thioalkalivibrio nitratireducens DSM 14787]|uniref:Methionyl-tRNA formyltransferase n=1 Tax=Thioalkalivibrio nitratireducens (strain DSM 14787 / UNIQEM 213 / ALEN2) TaxID=1255043 RepID=L0DSY8_THIND|nr:methionyl-tRNA formyltransferase [Thioalkalivibrio nitratireducens]AGA32123.1 Methionyl-tRNA formyltransferase [Thioalkalivibrio nitratireducens DSM 14787]
MRHDRRIVYAGTPEFAVPALEALIAAGQTPVAVYTQPDRPAGRGRKLTPSPVKKVALAAGIPVQQPVSLKSAEAQAELGRLAPDVLIVAAYGLILPARVLAIPRSGGVNVHASLLPRWRGAAPIQRAIQAGDPETGVCLMQMEPGLDTGPVYACTSLPLDDDATAASVHDRLASLGARLLVERLDEILDGTLKPRPQPAEGVVYARKIEKAEAWIDWARPAAAIDRQVRAFVPWPVAQTRWGDQVLRIHQARPLPAPAGPEPAIPGTVIGIHADGVDVSAGSGILRLQVVQLPGRRPVAAADWARSAALIGHRLGGVG